MELFVEFDAWSGQAGSGSGAAPVEPHSAHAPNDASKLPYYYAGAGGAVLLLLCLVFVLNVRRGSSKPKGDPRLTEELLDPSSSQQDERAVAPLPAGLVLACAVPRVVSQTYLVVEVTAAAGQSNSRLSRMVLESGEGTLQWTVQRRIGAFTSLAFDSTLSVAAGGAVARLGRWPTGAKHDPRTVEAQRQYADGWCRAVAGCGASAWGSAALRDFVAYDEHEQQLEALCSDGDVTGGSGGSPAGVNHKQYLTDSGEFDAPLQQVRVHLKIISNL